MPIELFITANSKMTIKTKVIKIEHVFTSNACTPLHYFGHKYFNRSEVNTVCNIFGKFIAGSVD